MRKMFVLMISILLIVFLSGCIEEKPTFEQGVYGKVTLTTGDCMMGASPFSCNEWPASRTIYIYETKTSNDMIRYQPYLNNTNNLIKTTKSSLSGYYELELEPGTYSIFVEDDDRQYCNSFGGHGEACQIIINNELIEYNININHAVW